MNRQGPVTAVIVGCGQRGAGYAEFAAVLPNSLKIVGAADPVQHRVDRIKRDYGLDDKSVFSDWRKLAAADKMADVAMICTQDKMHLECAKGFASKGYHLILEKPMSTSEEECEEMAATFKEFDVMVMVCHVLRFFPPCTKIKEIIDSGIMGEIITIDHRENIGYWHFAHSFVRGNWRRQDQSTFSLLAKSCHDLDLITYWMGSQKCTKIQSFGSLQHFKPSKAPKGAGSNCYDCPVEDSCPYSAVKIYSYDSVSGKKPRWPLSVVCDIEDEPAKYRNALEEALRTGPYGRCAYSCDNDVVDHQVVQMEFASGATAAFTMNAFTSDMRRETRICGSKGELRWDGSMSESLGLNLNLFGQGSQIIKADPLPQAAAAFGHGGADFFLVKELVDAVVHKRKDKMKEEMESALRSHKLVFAAEKSRLLMQALDIDI